MKKMVEDSNANLFSGNNDHDGLQLLGNFIDEGKLLDYDGIVQSDLAGPLIEKSLWATMIPWAWSLSNSAIHPVIM
jgi:hypothetical protein